jgi:hypothetical protein
MLFTEKVSVLLDFLKKIDLFEKDCTVNPAPFDKQFCMANTSVFISYITFQSYQKKIF